MFNEPFGLQDASIDGSKTMTRRAVPERTQRDGLVYAANHPNDEKAYERYLLEHAPYKVGEVVAIAQRYRDIVPPLDNKNIVWTGRGWNNKMYVKAEVMPKHIRILDVKVEGLAGISDEDCLREGIIDTGCGYTCYRKGVLPLFRTPYAAFKALIDKLNRRGFFESNPIVYAYTFEYVNDFSKLNE